MESPAVSARSVRLAYDGEEALRAEQLQVPEGAVTALVGPNGSGKSTLLSAVAGVLRPTAGLLEVFGKPPDASRQQVAYVLQSTKTAASLPVTVREVVTMGRYAARGLLRRLTSEDRAAVAEAMDRLEVGHLADRQLRKLSVGQRQRVVVAQGLAQQARMLLLDEPLTGLDLVSQRRIAEVVRDERVAGRTVLLATHDLAEAQQAHHVVLLAGRVVHSGPPEEVLTTSHLVDAYGGRILQLDGSGALVDEHVHQGVRTEEPR